MIVLVLGVLALCALTRRWGLLAALFLVAGWVAVWLLMPWVGVALAVGMILMLIAVLRTQRQDIATAKLRAAAAEHQRIWDQAEANVEAIRKAREF